LVMELVESGSMLELLLSRQRSRQQRRAGGYECVLEPPALQGMENVTVRRRGRRKAHDLQADMAQTARDGVLRLPPGWQLRLAIGAARGISVLHSLSPQVLHRDIKTSNLLVSQPDLVVKVCDFGLARFKLDNQSVRSFVGTASWVAPEVIMSRAGYTSKADVYSFGVVLWQIYARTQPYPNMHATQVLFQVAREGLRPKIPNSCPPEISALIERCWAHNPARRPNFAEIVTELERFGTASDEGSLSDREF